METKHIFIFVSLSINLLFSLPGKAQEDTLKNKPNIKINVHTQRDANGNIVGYDSSYVETWSSNGQNLNSDSLYKSQFKTFSDINSNHDRFFNFPNDSIFENMFPAFGMPDDDIFSKMFSFPNLDKLNKEMLNKMKQFYQHFDMPKDNFQKKKPVKKEKISFNTTNI